MSTKKNKRKFSAVCSHQKQDYTKTLKFSKRSNKKMKNKANRENSRLQLTYKKLRKKTISKLEIGSLRLADPKSKAINDEINMFIIRHFINIIYQKSIVDAMVEIPKRPLF
jgi:hypothetical protein